MRLMIIYIFLSHAFPYLFFNPFSQSRKYFSFPIYGIFCITVNRGVGAGIDTLMSISDGLGPSIFCPNMGKARPMREEMDGRVVYFPPESALSPLMLYFSTALFPISTLTWRANNYVSRQEKV